MGDIIVILIVALLAGLAFIKIRKDKKKGSTCGCGCSSCPSANKCNH